MKYSPAIAKAFFTQSGLPEPIFEYRFHPERKWRFDIAWGAPQRVALEVQGGIFIAGRHSRGAAILKEWEKLNTAACMGWRILYVQPKDLCLTSTVEMIKWALRK